jgi:glycosyltransferase involved in cell wall biosynthesis
MEAELHAFARKHRLPVEFRGFINQGNMPTVYDEADVLVLPSTAEETWGLVVNEAFACGRPAIVSSEIGSAGDLVVDGKNGRVFSNGSVHGLTVAMREVAASHGLRSDMARAALATAAMNTPDHAAAQTVSAVEYALRTKIR